MAAEQREELSAMAGMALEPGEQFRKAKRTLLAFAGIAMLFGLASIGSVFDPQVLGYGAEIRTWIVTAGLLIYTMYLYIGFEHERARVQALYSQSLVSAGGPERDPAAEVEALVEPLKALRNEFEMIDQMFGVSKRVVEQQLSTPANEILRLQQVPDGLDRIETQLRVAHADIRRLSTVLGRRERYMFTFYDTWAPRLFIGATAIVLLIDLLIDLSPS